MRLADQTCDYEAVGEEHPPGADEETLGLPPQWRRVIAGHRESSLRVAAQADLVASVDAQWRQLVRPEDGISEVRFYPVGDDMNKGRCLTVHLMKTGASFELTEKVLFGVPTYLAYRRSGAKRAAALLAELLETMVAGPGRPSEPVAGAELAWDRCVAGMRRYSWLKAWQADLLAGVDPRRAQLTEVYDNCRDFGVLRNGDTAENGRGVWVTVTGDQASLSLEDRSTSTGSQVIRTEAVGLDDAPRVFTEMVGTLGAGLVPAVLPAQEVFKRLLRDYVRPALGADGYAPAGQTFVMHRSGFEVTLRFRKSKFSTRQAVEYALDAGVAYPETVSLFDQANREAKVAGKAPERPPVGQWQSSLGHLAGHHAGTGRDCAPTTTSKPMLGGSSKRSATISTLQ